jgi:hypothetical protein
MKNYFEFDQDDKKMWLGLAAAGVLYVIAFSVFWGGFFHQIEKAVFFVLEDILPGYVIMKLFLDKLALSDNKITDRLMVSFAISLGVMELPFYLLKYLRPYEDNTDEKAWGAVNDTFLTFVLLLLVFGITFGVKYYQNKKKGIV